VTTEAPEDLGTVRTEIGVGTADLRNALRAVAAHASLDKETPVLQRVRLHIQRDNILAVATNRYTLAVAACSIWENVYTDNGVIVDLSLMQVGEILAMFKSKAEKDDDAGDDDLRIRLTDRYITMTDTAGLFPGKEVTWPRLATEEQFPDLLALMGGFHAKAGTGAAYSLHTSGRLLALFKVASAVYNAPVTIMPTQTEGGAMVLSIGESFVGALMPIKPSDEQVIEHAAWREAWDRRLGAVDMTTGEVTV
jgi:DNA polymerase III beta subunit, central domain